jgi:hypothetical protein
MTTIRGELLANGLQINFADQSNRYFGDYHRVSVVATIVCNLHDLPSTNPDEADFRRLAIETFGDELSIVKRFERMAVPTTEIDAVRAALVEDYLRHASIYLARPGYPSSLVAAELKKRRTPRFHG